MATLNDRTPAGTLAYCEYLITKGYATTAQVNPWRTAIQKVFETVDSEGWESLDLTTINLDEYLARFQTLAGAQYKAESIVAYKRRIKNALDAHEYYLTNGAPPSFRQGTRKAAKKDAGGSVVSIDSKQQMPAANGNQPGANAAPANGLVEMPYWLDDGRQVKFWIPARMKSGDVNRICAFIRTLQDDSPEQRQLPRQTGEEAA
jgi:hypothetical protein